MAKAKMHQSFKLTPSKLNLNLNFLYGIILVLLLIIGNFIFQNSKQKLGINELTATKPVGCYYQEVKCVKEPCEPILVCPPKPTPAQNCTQEAGMCRSVSGACVSYNNGCDKAQFCGTPFTSCGAVKPTPTPPACVCPAGIKCKLPSYCGPTASSGQYCAQVAGSCLSPSGSCVSYNDSCMRAKVCSPKLTACNITKPPVDTPKPPTPTRPLFFEVKNPCGTNSYAYVGYSCKSDGILTDIANGTCLDISKAFKLIASKCTF